MKNIESIFSHEEAGDVPDTVKTFAMRRLDVQCWQRQCFTYDYPEWQAAAFDLIVAQHDEMSKVGLRPVILCSYGFFNKVASGVRPRIEMVKGDGGVAKLGLATPYGHALLETNLLLGNQDHFNALVCWRDPNSGNG